MGISFANVQKMLIAVLLLTIVTAVITRNAMNTAFTAITLCSLVGFLWGISTRESTFAHLGLNSSGMLSAFLFIIVTILFAEWCMSMWGSESRVETYGLSLITIGTFWWSIETMEPTVVKENP